MRTLISSILLVALLAGAADAMGTFRAVDVYVDADRSHLGVYQIELTYDRTTVKVVSLEGGDHIAFKGAPYYDPRGMTAGRITIASFIPRSVKANNAPVGRTRVARLHLHIEAGDVDAAIRAMGLRLVVAADANGRLVKAKTGLETLGRARKEEAKDEKR